MNTTKMTVLCTLALLCLKNVYSQDVNQFNYNENGVIRTPVLSEELQVRGNVKVDSALFLPNTQVALTPQNNKLLVIGEDGFVQKSAFEELTPLFYTPITCPPGVLANPIWNNAPSTLYVHCPDDLKVGIGTFDPRVLLDVSGPLYTTNISIGSIDPATTSARFHLKHGNSIGTQPIFIVENTQQKLFEIGNDGVVRARELKVKLGNWPDYVFGNDYTLMPLNEVEEFISVNGHLPNIPKAAEVEDEGLNIGEMNRLLMEKIEELTLYIIDLQKQVDTLKNDNK